MQALATYPLLRKAVERTLITGQQKIETLRVQTYWETGRLIWIHIQNQKKQAEYGKRVILKLSEDLSIDRSVLNRTVRFHRSFPNGATWPHLTWSHYRLLLPIQDDAQRFRIAALANDNKWPVLRLTAEVENLTPEAGKKSGRLVRPTLGPLHHYRIIEEQILRSAAPLSYIDLGFGTHIPAKDLTAGNVVEVISEEGIANYRIKVRKDITPGQLFTYRPYVLRVIDGDTIWMHVELAFGIRKKVKIRLKGINTPERHTVEGQKAKAYVEKWVADSPVLTLKSTRAGKFDRYLGDLFNEAGEHLNQKLLDAGLAEKI